jgi:hypothetical protein
VSEIPDDGLLECDDGVTRCWWACSAAEYRPYHDTEWGLPVADDVRLFEKLSLEGFQAGLLWLTILRKREAFLELRAGAATGEAGSRPARAAGGHTRVNGARQGSQATRLAVRRADDGVRVHAVDGPGQRPSRRLSGGTRRRRRAREVQATFQRFASLGWEREPEGLLEPAIAGVADMNGAAVARSPDPPELEHPLEINTVI